MYAYKYWGVFIKMEFSTYSFISCFFHFVVYCGVFIERNWERTICALLYFPLRFHLTDHTQFLFIPALPLPFMLSAPPSLFFPHVLPGDKLL